MNVVHKRLIAIMVSAVMLACAGVSFIKASNLNDDYVALNQELDMLQTQLYDSLKNDPDYHVEYKRQLSELQQNFFSGKIGAQQYDNQLSELNSDSFTFNYSQRPEVKEEYKNEIAEIEIIQNKVHDVSVNKSIPYLLGFIAGTTGCLAGISVVTSTIKTDDDINSEVNKTDRSL